MGEREDTRECEDLAGLLERVARRESSALEALYDAVAPSLLGVIRNVLRNKEESEDVLQEVFLQIWKRADHYDPKLGKPISWLITVARNRAYDRARTMGRKADLKKEREDELVLAVGETVARQNSPGMWRDECERVDDAMNQLSSDQRQAIQLAFYSGMTQREVAKFTDVPLGTVKARIRRGLMKLKERLTAAGIGSQQVGKDVSDG